MCRELMENSFYLEDIENVSRAIDFTPLYGKTVMISGATGMIGSFIVDLLMHLDQARQARIRVIALGRNQTKAHNRFAAYFDSPNFTFYECDITKPLTAIEDSVDYIIHAASTTHPLAYSTEPIGTITSNVFGTKNLLDYGIAHGLKRFVFLSSVEIYGENRGDVDYFDEDYCGYINCNTLRAGYPESKRLCEAMCQAYRKEKNIEIVIPRLPRIFGPTMLMSDTKAVSQFIKKAIAGENIELKSEGLQLYSYLYVADAASGIVAALLNGDDGETYNICDESNCILLKDLASFIATRSHVEVVFKIPETTEQQGYSVATKAIMSHAKAKRNLNWSARYSIEEGITRTIMILNRKC